MEKGKSSGREWPNGDLEAAEQEAGLQSIRSRLRERDRGGAVRDPEVLANYKPRTVLGLIVRALVLEAGKRNMTAVTVMMHIIDWDDDDEDAKGSSTHSSNSLRQGISQGILKKVGPKLEAAEVSAPLNRQQRRRLAVMKPAA
jgi:hypothetical protein